MQPWNKSNATSGDYRGQKIVLNQRVIEGLSNFDLADNELKLSYDAPKWCIIKNHGTNKVYLPDASTLKNGWLVSIINQDIDPLEVALYTDSESYTLLNEIAGQAMAQFLLEDNSTRQGQWRMITSGEYSTENSEKYTTSVFEESNITYKTLNSGSYRVFNLADIPAGTPVRSIYFKPTQQFVGANTYLDIGTTDDPDKFYSQIQINSIPSESNYTKDLFEEILSTENSDSIVATFYTDNDATAAWNNVTLASSVNYKNVLYGNGIFLALGDSADSTVVSYCSEEDDSTWTNFDLSTIPNYINLQFNASAAYYDDYTSKFYIFGKKADDYFAYITFDGEDFEFIETLVQTTSAPLKTLKVSGETKIISDNYVLSISDLETGSFAQTTFTSLSDTIREINYGNGLYVFSGDANYYTTSDFVTFSTVANTNKYVFKYLKEEWVRFRYNDSVSTVVATSADFIVWNSKDISISNILNMYYFGNAYKIITDPSYDSNKIISSTDFFTTIAKADSTFSTNEIAAMNGNPANLVIVGQSGEIAYINGEDFYSLTSGEIKISIEKVKTVDPILIKNPIINTQLPFGTFFHYAFQDLPEGYVRLDGTVIPDARNMIPTFVEKLDQQTSNLVIPEVQYTNTITNYGFCGRFCWVNNNKDLKFPTINCFVRGLTGDLSSMGAAMYDTMRPITGKVSQNIQGASSKWGGGTSEGALEWVDLRGDASWEDNVTGYSGIKIDSSKLGPNYAGTETAPKHVLYPYIMSVYNATQTDSNINADTIMESVKLNQNILQQCYTMMASVTSNKNPEERQCIIDMEDRSRRYDYVTSSGLVVSCISGIAATSAQGFDATNKTLALDSEIITTSNLTKTIAANTTGYIYLKKAYVDAAWVVSLESTSEYYETSVAPTAFMSGALWYDTFNQKMLSWSGTQWESISAVVIANYLASSSAVSLSNIRGMRNGGRKMAVPNLNRAVSKTYGSTYTAEIDGFLNILLSGSYRNDFKLEYSLDNGSTWITRAIYGDNRNADTKWITGEFFIPRGVMYRTSHDTNVGAFESITLTFYPCEGVY